MERSRPPLDIADCVNTTCPWSGKPVSAEALTLYRGQVVGFCNSGCRDKFEAATSLFDRTLAEKAISGDAADAPATGAHDGL